MPLPITTARPSPPHMVCERGAWMNSFVVASVVRKIAATARSPANWLKQRRCWEIAVTPRFQIGLKWLQLQCVMVLRQ
jgi:hypothetical protein